MKNLVLLLTLLVFASGAFAQERQRKTITTDDLYEYFDEEDFVPNEILGASFTEFILKELVLGLVMAQREAICLRSPPMNQCASRLKCE